MGTISHLPRRDRPLTVRFSSETEAEAALDTLLDAWKWPEASGFPERREALKLCGLTAVSLASEAGGLDCANRLLTESIRRIHRIDPGAAQALHRHFVLLEQFRSGKDESFYARLADQVFAGDLLFSDAEKASRPLLVQQQDFQPLAHGTALLPHSALWADWLWVAAVNEGLPTAGPGAVLVPMRAAVLESVTDGEGRSCLAARFDAAPVTYGLWGSESLPSPTADALDRLLEAARSAAILAHSLPGEPGPGADLRRDIACHALLALIAEAALALDQAQVDASSGTVAAAERSALHAVLFAMDLRGNHAAFLRLAAAADLVEGL